MLTPCKDSIKDQLFKTAIAAAVLTTAYEFELHVHEFVNNIKKKGCESLSENE